MDANALSNDFINLPSSLGHDICSDEFHDVSAVEALSCLCLRMVRVGLNPPRSGGVAGVFRFFSFLHEKSFSLRTGSLGDSAKVVRLAVLVEAVYLFCEYGKRYLPERERVCRLTRKKDGRFYRLCLILRAIAATIMTMTIPAIAM